ncbi:GNAT family N-acetyltransferase [Streptomyces sp. NBC_00872]|uniref:GNAT family N-acetyltransferase n=1 Tax=Streptomyces sp. NBC_00872 TaxID=2903686 RepID=UPI00386E37F4|nr:GNAT family N-acetyltransferase [Streptomyces sp. NBC_00872]
MIELRELKPNDRSAVQASYGYESVRFLDRGPMGEVEAVEYIHRAMAWSTDRPRLRYVFGIDVNGDLVGVVKLNVVKDDSALSYILRRNSWGRGYATAAVLDLMDFAFDALRVSTVHAKHRVDNAASGRVLVKAGFTLAGTAHGFSRYRAKRP